MSRFSNALLGALALHGALFLARARHAARPSAPLTVRAPEELVEVEEAEVAPGSAPTPNEARLAARDATAAAAVGAAHTGDRTPDTEVTSSEAAPADSPSVGVASAAAVSASSAQASAEPPPRKIDLGLDGFFMRPPSEELPRVPKSAFQRQLEASLSAEDVRHGLARGNALLGSLNAAVRDTGPVRGDALLRVTVGPDGSMTDVEFLRGSAADWSSALESFRALAARKHVRVPPGARGLRVTFAVQAKVQRPSGKEVDAAGLDVAPPSLSPNGMTLHGTFDLADLGGGPQRLVYARVVSEEVL